jgi:hypothetical protein
MRGAFALAHFVAASFAGFGASLTDRKERLSLLGTEKQLVVIIIFIYIICVLAVAVASRNSQYKLLMEPN